MGNPVTEGEIRCASDGRVALRQTRRSESRESLPYDFGNRRQVRPIQNMHKLSVCQETHRQTDRQTGRRAVILLWRQSLVYQIQIESLPFQVKSCHR